MIRPGNRVCLVLLVAALGGATLLSGCNTWRVIFPSRSYDTDRPDLPGDLGRPAVLLLTKTNGFRHHQAIDAGVPMFEAIAERRGWSLFHTENAAVVNRDDLARFDVAVWHNTSGDILDEDQKRAFRAWLEGGGGFVGVHGAGGDASYDWRWYVEELVGAQFTKHVMGPQFQDATLVVEDRTHPATRDLPASLTHNEEWYSFEHSVREKPGFTVLASVDESSYSPRFSMLWHDEDISMGDHPVVWSHCVGEGRAFFSALGHQAAAYETPEIQKLMEGAVAWAAGVEGDGC